MTVSEVVSNPYKLRILKATNDFFWYVYLLLIALISFANTPANSLFWFKICAFIFLYAGLYFASLCYQIKPNFKTLYSARFALIFLSLMLLWGAFLQLVPMSSYLDTWLFSHADQPNWFENQDYLGTAIQENGWVLLSYLTALLLLVLTLLQLESRQRVKHLMWVIMGVCVMQALIGIYGKYAGTYFIDKGSLDGHYEAARGLFVNRNHLGIFVVLCLCPALAMQIKRLASNQTSSPSKLVVHQIVSWSFLFFLIGFACILLSQSRAALWSLIACMVFYMSVLFPRNSIVAPSNKGLRYFYLSLTALGVIFAFLFGQEVFERLFQNGFSIGERSTQWAITWQAIKHELLFGYGVGSYELVFQTFRDYEKLRAVIYDQAHNDYLHLLLEQGLVGLSLWLAFIASIFVYAIQNYKKSKSTLICAVLLGSLISISAILLQSFVDYPLQIMTIKSYFFVMIGLIFAVPKIRHL